LCLPAPEFELGRILSTEGDATLTLETMVPLGDRSVPFFRLNGSVRAAFEANVRDHPAVSDIHIVNTHDDETLYALNWDSTDDAFLSSVVDLDGHAIEAAGGSESWVFQLRFPTHGALSDFQQYCFDSDVPLDVRRIYNPTRPEAGPWYGLTKEQRETLTYAVENGYYSLPRRTSTQDIADEFGISDQAVTERLRRAIDTLTTNTLLLTDENQGD
jgi:predicted DNA binding protein